MNIFKWNLRDVNDDDDDDGGGGGGGDDDDDDDDIIIIISIIKPPMKLLSPKACVKIGQPQHTWRRTRMAESLGFSLGMRQRALHKIGLSGAF